MAITLNTSIGPVTIEEMYENFTPGIDPSRGPFIEKMYVCPDWASYYPSINALMGVGPTPFRHVSEDSPNLVCVSAVGEPRGPSDLRDGGRPVFNLPVIKATYGILTWDEQSSGAEDDSNSFPNEAAPDTPYLYMEQSIDFSVETLPLPKRAFRFADGTPSDVPFTKFVAVADFTLIRHWQQKLPFVNFTQYMGKVNTATFLGQPKGQILFLKGRTRREFTNDGNVTQEVELRFRWREQDHNKTIRQDTGLWDTLLIGGAGPGGTIYPHAYIDLSPLVT